jgi:EAL domain-containing protein (putative c-di-GMP-specific phosphodiesterase class I)
MVMKYSQVVTSAKTTALRRFLREGRMTIAFQPIWDVARGRMLAFEALARPDADYGFAGPQEMFDLGECLGRAHELDAICVRAVLAHAARLPGDALLFMNLTPRTLVRDGWLTGSALPDAVVSAGLPPSRVVLEITERSNVELKEIVKPVNFLRHAGFQVALDDIGAEHAGPEMLSQIPADFVKIDRSVVEHALTDRAALSMLIAIIALARESGMGAIAEGIESLEILTLVRQLKGSYGQGYFLGHPSESIPDASSMGNLTLFSPSGGVSDPYIPSWPPSSPTHSFSGCSHIDQAQNAWQGV